jgi:DNA-binding transcriptional MerR regulator
MSSEPAFRINVAAEMSGVSETLLRAWERRYGVPRPTRTASGYRTYARSEIELLRRLRILTESGVSIKEAVELVPQIERELSAGPKPIEIGPGPESFVDGVLLAAGRFDQASIEAALGRAASVRPPVDFFEQFVTPLMREVGERWHARRLSIAEEHLITHAVREKLTSLLASAPRRAKRHVICACLPAEDHDIGLLGAALRFRHSGWKVTFLGARTPARQLAAACRKLEPDLVAVSAVRSVRGLSAIVKSLPEGTQIVVGGAAARSAEHPIRVIDGPEAWARLLEELP